jgi:hypothetical protein
MILYFVALQLAFAALIALSCIFVLGLAGVYVSVEGRRPRPAWVKIFMSDDSEEADFLFRFSREHLRTSLIPKAIDSRRVLGSDEQ